MSCLCCCCWRRGGTEEVKDKNSESAAFKNPESAATEIPEIAAIENPRSDDSDTLELKSIAVLINPGSAESLYYEIRVANNEIPVRDTMVFECDFSNCGENDGDLVNSHELINENALPSAADGFSDRHEDDMKAFGLTFLRLINKLREDIGVGIISFSHRLSAITRDFRKSLRDDLEVYGVPQCRVNLVSNKNAASQCGCLGFWDLLRHKTPEDLARAAFHYWTNQGSFDSKLPTANTPLDMSRPLHSWYQSEDDCYYPLPKPGATNWKLIQKSKPYFMKRLLDKSFTKIGVYFEAIDLHYPNIPRPVLVILK